MEFILRTATGTRHLSTKGRIEPADTEPMRFSSSEDAFRQTQVQPDFAELVVDVAPAPMPVGVEV